MSAHREGFFRDILANPGDDTPRLIYADWLDDQGDSARAEFIRVQCEIPKLTDTTKRGVLRKREADLFAEHQAKWAKPLVDRNYHAEFDRGLLSEKSAREAAGQISYLSEASKFEPIFAELGPDLHLCHLTAYLVQEVVLRDQNDAHLPALLQSWDLLKRVGHPLTWLPLTLERWECRYTLRDRMHQLLPLTAGIPFILPDTNDTTVCLENVTAPNLRDRILSAVRNWEQDSNGDINAEVYQCRGVELHRCISIPLINAVGGTICGSIDRLTGDCLQNAFHQLLRAACFGGVYKNETDGRATGRLLAWKSLAGLVGAAPDASAEEVAQLAERTIWLSFHSSDFYDMVDIGLIAIRPDRQSMALLMGTDVD
jgi:uncharacterized protein (TIGR02996 family)